MEQSNIFMVQPLPVKQFSSGGSFAEFASLFRVSKKDYMKKYIAHLQPITMMKNLYHPKASLLWKNQLIKFSEYFNERGITEETTEIIKIMINNHYYKDFDNLIKTYDKNKMAVKTDFHKMPYHKFCLGEIFRNTKKYLNTHIESAEKDENFELMAYHQVIKTKFTKTIDRFDEFVKSLEEQLFSQLTHPRSPTSKLRPRSSK